MKLNEQWSRLLAAGKVRWMPGMLAVLATDEKPSPEDGDYRVAGAKLPRYNERHLGSPMSNAVPVWTDPATIGCLHAMTEDATGDKILICAWSSSPRVSGWACVWSKPDGTRGAWSVHPTKAGALLAAIEAAT